MVQSAGIRVYDEGGGGGGGTVSDGVVQLDGGSAYAGDDGGEAALFDQAGTQILGRTAVRHWLDPHPDAAAFDETWEFSTTGDMTQGELETAGWTFSNMTGEVSNGILWLTASSDAGYLNRKAYLTVNLTGDFDIMVCPIAPFDYADHNEGSAENGAIYVEDTANDVAHGVIRDLYLNGNRATSKLNGTSVSWAGSGFQDSFFNPITALRIWRVSGTVYVAGGFGPPYSRIEPDDTAPHTYNGWTTVRSAADADTFQRVSLGLRGSNQPPSTEKVGFAFLRRFQ